MRKLYGILQLNNLQFLFAYVSRTSAELASAQTGLLLLAETATGDNTMKREAMALLLPPAQAYLHKLPTPALQALHVSSTQQLPQHDSPAAAPAAASALKSAGLVTDVDPTATASDSDAVRAFFAREMVQYMTAKVKAPQGQIIVLLFALQT